MADHNRYYHDDEDDGLPPIEFDEFLQGRLDHHKAEKDALLREGRNGGGESDACAPERLPEIEIIGARGLNEAPWAGWGLSERFAVCEVPGKPKSKVQTPALDDTQKAEWGHKDVVQDYELGDELLFSVIATHTKFKTWRAVLGTTSIRADDFSHPAGFDGELPLVEIGHHAEEAFLRVKVALPHKDAEHHEESNESNAAGDVRPKPKRKLKPGQADLRPVSVPSILEEALKLANRDVESRRQEETGDEDVKHVEDLPEGWEAAWDELHQRYYFYNHDLGTSSWEWPTEAKSRRSEKKRQSRSSGQEQPSRATSGL